MWAESAGVTSKLRMRVKIIYFILFAYVSISPICARGEKERTDSSVEKWYPMQALEPPRKLMILPHTPGRACAPGGIFSQRSGLNISNGKHQLWAHGKYELRSKGSLT